MLKVPSSVQRNARKGLELRKFYKRGGTEVGEASARKLASGSISEAFARHMLDYFPRHAGDLLEQTEKSAKGPSNGYIAWLLWGGNEGRDWLTKKLKAKETKMRKRNSPYLTMPDRATAEAFADAARKAGHSNVFVTSHKGKIGVLLGTMSDEDAQDLQNKLRGLKAIERKPKVVTADREKPKMGLVYKYVAVPSGKNTTVSDVVRSQQFDNKSKAQDYAKLMADATSSAYAVVHWPFLQHDGWTEAMEVKKKNPKKPSSKAGLPANASAQQIYAKLKQLSHLKTALEDKGTRKDFIKAERIAQQMKALALKHQKALGLQESNPLKRKSVKKNPSLKRGLKAIGKTVSGRVSKIAKRIGSRLKKLTPSGRRSTAAIKRLQEASKGDPLGKTKRMILDARKRNSSKLPVYKDGDYWVGDGGKDWLIWKVNGVASVKVGTVQKSFPWEKVLSAIERHKAFVPPSWARKGKKNPKRKPSVKRKPSRKRNSAAASSALYEQFHGKPSTSILEIEEEWHIHKNLAQLGTLVEIKVLLNPTESKSNQRRATLAVPHSDNALKGVQLCSSENKGKTLYLIGGDQSLPLKALGFTAADEKDLMYIGEIEELTYRTQKHFDKFQRIDYYHGLGEVSKVRPQLLYRSRDKKLLIAGGQYDVRPEGIVN
jgi:hypothetical protein